MTRVAPPLAALAAVVALTGCGGRVVAHESIERLLELRLPHAGAIRCPDVDDAPGTRFTCRAAGGRTVRARVAAHERIRFLGVR